MNWKLVASLACGAALLLGACSGNNAAGTTGGQAGPGTDGNGDSGDGNGGSGDGNGGSGDGSGTDGNGAAPTPLSRASDAYTEAQAAVSTAVAAAARAVSEDTDTARAEARRLIGLAEDALDRAVLRADDAVAAAAGGSFSAIGAAARAKTSADALKNSQVLVLDTALASFGWYTAELRRSAIPNGDVDIPPEGANTVTIKRIPRTIATSATDSTQKANPDAIQSDTFSDIMYSDGDEVLSLSGDEFKVHGFTLAHSADRMDHFLQTGLSLTSDGLKIRTGGTYPGTNNVQHDGYSSNSWRGDRLGTDYSDMKKNIKYLVDDADFDGQHADDSVKGQNGWDLEITFNAPNTMSAPTIPAPNAVTSWAGNGDFYWKGIVPADPSQTSATGEHYESGNFLQPKGFEDLGTYEVWLSNHIGVDSNREPVAGSSAPAYPDDDEQRYLNYAAYGLFVYTVDEADTVYVRWTAPRHRIQSMHFGYDAFADRDGQRTTDIGTAITSGTFKGQTLAYAFRGGQTLTPQETKSLRGDVSLTVNIPKTMGTGTVTGTIDNFAEWTGNRWNKYSSDFKVQLNDGEATPAAVGVTTAGTFRGITTLESGTGDPLTQGAAGNLGNDGKGFFFGKFYGPRENAADLEAAGSWLVGGSGYESGTHTGPGGGPNTRNVALWRIWGSFGAKQVPAAASQ